MFVRVHILFCHVPSMCAIGTVYPNRDAQTRTPPYTLCFGCPCALQFGHAREASPPELLHFQARRTHVASHGGMMMSNADRMIRWRNGDDTKNVISAPIETGCFATAGKTTLLHPVTRPGDNCCVHHSFEEANDSNVTDPQRFLGPLIGPLFRSRGCNWIFPSMVHPGRV